MKELTIEKAAEKAVSLSLPLKGMSLEGLVCFGLSYFFIVAVVVGTVAAKVGG